MKPFTRIKYIDGDDHIDNVLRGYPVKLIRAFFVRNVEIVVNRWPEHIDVIIRMPQQLYGQAPLRSALQASFSGLVKIQGQVLAIPSSRHPWKQGAS